MAPAAQARRTVTVVFADLAGSTSLQERLDPESVRRLMDDFYGALAGAVDAHDGTVVKFTGDGLMAGFGIGTVDEDDAWRAVQTAAEMQARFADLGWNAPLALRVGVNTGEVIVTEGELDVVGDAVNVAARLESAAAGGEVLVGEDTWRLTRQLARFDPVVPLQLRGKVDPVPAYRLIGLGAERDTAAPFVGRVDELARLRAGFDSAVTTRTARLATVVGSPGLGKSRLADELEARLGSAIALKARCSATTASTFAPILDALRTAGVGEAELSEVASAPSPQAAFLTVRRALERLAGDHPVFLVMDDVHWAEPLLLDLVEHLVEWTRDAPLFVLALARPEIREVRPALVESGGRAADVVVLEGLPPDASAQLACDLLETDHLPALLVERILDASAGNPLYVREVVRMLVDDGVLRREGDSWRPTIEVDAIAVPPTVQSLLTARIERLPASERAVLERAAIAGREFFRGAVSDLLPTDARGGLDAVLERLRQKELIEPAGSYWVDEPVLRFHHVLLRDAAYRRLLKEVRADLHERYAAWLDSKAVDVADNDEVAGFHLEQAHQYRVELGIFDDHSALLGHRAADRLAGAGRRALDRDDLPAAAGLLGRALGRLPGDDPARADLLIDHCEALIATGALADGALALAELEQLGAHSPRLRAWASCFAAQLTTLTDATQLHDAAAAVQDAATELNKLHDAAGAAKAHAVHAAVLARLGRVGECESALDRALAAAREAGDSRRATAVLAGAPLAALWGPSPVARASGRCLDVVRVLRITTGATTVEATSLRCQAVLESLRGRTDAARRMLGAARRSLEELGHRHGLLSTEMFAGLVELSAGDAVAAENAFRAAHDGFVALGASADAAQAAALLGRAVLAQDRLAEAETVSLESERLGGADLKTAIAWRAVRAQALARHGRVDEALDLARAAVELAEPTDALLDQADAHLTLATVLRFARRHDDAALAAGRAVELYERKGATVLAERAAELIAASPSGDPTTVSDDRPADATRAGVRENTAARRLRERATADGALDLDLLATRGVHLALIRTAEALRLGQTDAEGRLVLDLTFNRDDLPGAIHELDARYGRDDPAVAQSWSAALAFIESLNARAWGDFRAVFAPDFVAVDRRPAGFGTLDGDGITEWAQGLAELAPDNWLYAIEVPVIDAQGHVALVVNRGTANGSPFEMVRAVTATLRGDQLTRIEFFAAEELAEAEARLVELTRRPDELGAAPESGVQGADAADRYRPANAVTRSSELYGRYAEAGDWDKFVTLFRPDAVMEDRRPGLQYRLTGVEHYVKNAKPVTASTHRVSVPVATRGDRLGLMHSRFTGRDQPFEVEMLELGELDEDGLLVSNVIFEGSAIDEAIAELDHRYRLGEGAPYGAVLDAVLGFTGDHRLFVTSFPRISRVGAVATLVGAGGHTDGEPSEITTVQLFLVTDEGLQRHEVFAAGEVEAALARFDELTRRAPWENTCTRLTERFDELFMARDWVGMAAIVAPDVQQEDRRRGSQMVRLGVDAYVESAQSIAALGDSIRIDREILATRGDRLCLLRNVFSGEISDGGRAEAETLLIREVNADGLFCHTWAFDPEDEEAAFGELDRQFRAGLTGAARDAIATGDALQTSLDARDWSAFETLLAPDLVVLDHRGLGFQRRSRDDYVASTRALLDLAPDLKARNLCQPRATAAGAVALWDFSGTYGDGTPFERPFVILSLMRDGVLTNVETFAPEDLGSAVARFDALTSSGAGGTVRPNSASRWIDRYTAALVAREPFDPTWMDDHCRLDDRRTGTRSVTYGVDAFRANHIALFGIDERAIQPVASRGDRLTLFRSTWRGQTDATGPFEVDTLDLLEVNDQGLARSFTLFDPEDLDAAFEELDRLFAEGEAADALAAWQLMRTAVAAHAAGDRELFVAQAEGVTTVVDHRPLGWGELRGETFRELSSTAHVESRMRCLAVPAISDRGICAVLGNSGTMPHGGGAWEAGVVVVAHLTGETADRLEFFAPEQIDAAMARLDELTSPPATAGIPPNAASRWIDMYTAALVTRSPFDSHWLGDGCRLDDRRASTRSVAYGDDALRANHIGMFGIDERAITHVASRGDRLLLFRSRWRGHTDAAGPFEVDTLDLLEVNEQGLARSFTVFDPDEVDAAFEELDRLFTEGEGARDTELWSAANAYLAGYAARDWDAVEQVLAPNLVAVDHQPGGWPWPARGAEMSVTIMREMANQVTEDRLMRVAVLRSSPHVGVSLLVHTGTDAQGSEFERRMVTLTVVEHGQITRLEYWREGDADAAASRFEELTSGD